MAAQTMLPPVVVEGAQSKAKPAKQAKQKSSAPAAEAAKSDASSAQPKAESATGPVQGYVAKQSATGTKTDTPLREIPQSISVVGAEQIRDQGAQTVQDALRYVPGTIADAYGIDSRTDSIIIRGTEAAEYLDGLRRTFNYYIYNYRIDPYFMERIEVLRGPASVLYGQAPVGGIVNSVSKRPQEEEKREITVEYGSHDFKQVKTDMTGKLTEDGKWLYRIVALGRDAGTQVDYVEDDRLALAPSLTYRPQPGTSLTLMGHFQKDSTGSTAQFLPHVGTIFPNVSGDHISRNRFIGEPSDKYNTDVASGTLLFEHKINETFKLSHSMRYADIHNEYNSTYAGFFAGLPTYTGAHYTMKLDGINDYLVAIDPDPTQRTMARIKSISTADTQMFNSDTNLEAKLQTGTVRHRVLGGVDYASFNAQSWYGDAVNVTPFNVYAPVHGQPENLFGYLCGKDYAPVGYAPEKLSAVPVCRNPDQSVTQTGLYVQDQMRLGRWIGIVGARYDWIENTTGSDTQKDQAATYRAGLMYEFPSGLTPYVSYSQSFVPVVGLDVDGNPFDPQKGEMVEVGFKYQLNPSLVINSAVYDIKESNRVVPGPFGNFNVQTGAVSIRGFEIEALGRITPNIKMVASYSFTDAKYSEGDYDGLRVESVPQHLASLWGIYAFSEGSLLQGFSIGAGVRYIGSSWDERSDASNSYGPIETPAVTLFDAMIAYDTKNWRWSLNAYNLEDETYYSTCLGRGDCFTGQGRTVTTAFTYKF